MEMACIFTFLICSFLQWRYRYSPRHRTVCIFYLDIFQYHPRNPQACANQIVDGVFFLGGGGGAKGKKRAV